MGNLVRLKQIDQAELSGYAKQIGDANYYSISNPSGFISSVKSDPTFLALSGNVNIFSGDIYYNLNSTGITLSSNLNSTGSSLNTKINNLSGYLEISNLNISSISGSVDNAKFLATGLDYSSNLLMSGNIVNTSGYASGISGVLNSKLITASGSLSSRISSLENNFTLTGSNFVDLNSNNQTILGQKNFDARTNFKLLNIVPISGDYSNPGGLNSYMYTQFIDNNLFYVSGLGYKTGDFFVTKIRYPNNEECIISSNIYTGNY